MVHQSYTLNFCLEEWFINLIHAYQYKIMHRLFRHFSFHSCCSYWILVYFRFVLHFSIFRCASYFSIFRCVIFRFVSFDFVRCVSISFRSLVQPSKSRATRNDRLQCTWMTSFYSVHICIAFRLLRRGNMKLHALLGHPVSENFVSWCQTLKNSSASFLCIQETYRSSPRSRNLKVIKKCVHLKCICV